MSPTNLKSLHLGGSRKNEGKFCTDRAHSPICTFIRSQAGVNITLLSVEMDPATTPNITTMVSVTPRDSPSVEEKI